MHTRSGAIVAALLTCALVSAQTTSLKLARDLGPEPVLDTWSFPLRVNGAQTRLFLETDIKLTAGQLTIRLTDPNGAVLRSDTTTGELKLNAPLVAQSAGTFQLEVIAERAQGHWEVHLFPMETAFVAGRLLISGTGMIVVALAGVLYWRRRSRTRWAWFWVGAAVWSVGVGLKFAWAIPLNKPILHTLNQILPAPAYLPCACVYIGLLTGIFEVGVTLAAALIWRQWTTDAGRAGAIALGAGAFEALLVGLLGVAQALMLAAGVLPDEAAGQIVGLALLTPLMWLVGPVERAFAILCHTSSRMLTLLAVAQQRWRLFWAGFAVLTAIDAVAGYALLSGALSTHSVWWVELAIAPAAIISIPIIVWCVRRWPRAPSAPSPDAGAPALSSE